LLEVSRAAGVLLSLLLQTASWHLTAFSTFSTNSDQTLKPSLSRTHIAVVHTCEKASATPHFPPRDALLTSAGFVCLMASFACRAIMWKKTLFYAEHGLYEHERFLCP
jgi:hypothetical protein